MPLKLNLIAAACENMGIGKNNNLPWKLRSEMEYFTKMTKSTKDPAKRNVVIMGRRTWESIPKKFKPLDDRINIVLSRQDLEIANLQNVYHFKSLEAAIDGLESKELSALFENVWIIGGSKVYEDSMKSKYFYRLYLTEIRKSFDCDTFFPPLKENLLQITVDDVPRTIQQEGDIEFMYKVYESPDYKSQ